MSKIKLAIFDLDGVITSTTNEHFHAWELVFRTHFNINIDPSLESYTKGVSRIESLNVICNQYGLALSEDEKIQLAIEKNNIYNEMISSFNSKKVLSGVQHLLSYLKSHDIKLALGSASKNGKALLKLLDLEGYFDYIVDPTNLKSKPSPDIFNNAKNYFGFRSDQCIGIEDALSGIKAIKAAEMFAIGVGNEKLSDADIYVETLPQLYDSILDKIIEGKFKDEHSN